MQAQTQWFFNIFQAANHFATQFNLSTPLPKFAIQT